MDNIIKEIGLLQNRQQCLIDEYSSIENKLLNTTDTFLENVLNETLQTISSELTNVSNELNNKKSQLINVDINQVELMYKQLAYNKIFSITVGDIKIDAPLVPSVMDSIKSLIEEIYVMSGGDSVTLRD